ncbi:MAG: hypothetical protein PUD16_02870 [bacterium]|nr:hypothetical protein [bacterium]
MCQTMEKVYPCGRNTGLMIAGYVLLAAGIILLFVCIPGWVWLALLGVLLMAAGTLLLKLSHVWR